MPPPLPLLNLDRKFILNSIFFLNAVLSRAVASVRQAKFYCNCICILLFYLQTGNRKKKLLKFPVCPYFSCFE